MELDDGLEDHLLRDDPPAPSEAPLPGTNASEIFAAGQVEEKADEVQPPSARLSKCQKKNLRAKNKKKALRRQGKSDPEGVSASHVDSLLPAANSSKAEKPGPSRGSKLSKRKHPYRPMPRNLFSLAWDKINQGLHLQREGLEMMRFYRFDG